MFTVKYSRAPLLPAFVLFLLLATEMSIADGKLNVLDFGSPTHRVDTTGKLDSSDAVSRAVVAANNLTAYGLPACVYFPTGTYRITKSPPQFARAGCVVGDGSSLSKLILDSQFAGDLFTWSEAWADTTPGPRVVGLQIVGSRSAAGLQNALIFYDRNDKVFLDDIEITQLHGRALYSGVIKQTKTAYMRESHMRSMRFFDDGAPNLPVVEFTSQGEGNVDATNEIRITQLDIYGSDGPSFVIRNNGSGSIRSISIQSLRIEGKENGRTSADLMTIGDAAMKGNINNVSLDDLELVDPYRGYAALRLVAAPNAPAPYHIVVRGSVGGGLAHGEGLRLDAARSSSFQFSEIHTEGTNIVIGPNVSAISLDGYGDETKWTYAIDASSSHALLFPVRQRANPIATQ